MKRLIKLEKKKVDINKDIKVFLNPDNITIPKTIDVKLNDYVYMSEFISVSGRVIDIKDNSITIENDFRELVKDNISKNAIKTKIDLVSILPKINDLNRIDGIVVNAINDEPYVYNRIFLLKENMRNILDTVNKIAKILKVDNNMIAIKNNESFIIDECLNVIGTYPNIKIALLSDEYLIGYKPYLLKKLNMSNNTLYLSIEEVLKLTNKIKGFIETTELITITYNDESTVYQIKLGTSLKSIISKYYNINSYYSIVINGLMSGYVKDDINDIYINNDIESVYINDKPKIKEKKCLNCGLCEQVCPENVSIFKNKNRNKCLHCGLCSYMCPAHINLDRYLGDSNE